MKISLKWLQDFVDVSDYMQKPEALADLLTKAGLEVEEITNKAKTFDFVVTGLILEKDQHPNADKLSLCKVTTGEGVVHQIVCGAKNHNKNDKVVVALPGAVLPGNFAIKQSQIRGVDSGGMLCSLKELGLSGDGEGIIILPSDAPVGKPFAKYKGLDDVTFELKVTPNRADCLSHYGLAREVACLLGRSLKNPNNDITFNENSTQKEISVEVKNKEQCPRYAGRFISGVKVGPSPDWLKQRLESIGMNSINNIVDVTNYIMMELGQPLHAFDSSQLKGKKVVVEQSTAGELFQTLDGSELKLKGDELMIRDGERSVAIAGVIGGKNSGVSESTNSIFLEAAYFSPMSVRKASRAHGINTDSGYRFSRGVDPDNTVRAMDRAVQLIIQVAGGVAYSDHHDFYPQPVKKQPVSITIETVSQRLGYSAESVKFEDFMQRLGCRIEKTEDGKYQILPPTFRFDLETDMDLVEEYARLNGYDQIPDAEPWTHTAPSVHDEKFIGTKHVVQVLQSQGYLQAMNFAFVGQSKEAQFLQDKSKLSQCGLLTSEEAIGLLNPLSDDLNVMRSTLSFGLFQNANYNFHQGNEFGKLFEVGSTFSKSDKGEYVESLRLGIMAWGWDKQLWDKQESPLVFHVKGALEALFRNFNFSAVNFVNFSDKGSVPQFLHRGQNVCIQLEGKVIGFLGSVHPQILEEQKIRVPMAICEIDLTSVLKGLSRSSKFKSVSKYQKVVRDLSLVMENKISVGDVMKEINKSGGNNLVDVDVFDIYQGDKLEKGQKSITFRLCYQDQHATLHDDVVNQSINSILDGLKQKFAISMR